jgi:OOP family OmpA-OmpF porin
MRAAGLLLLVLGLSGPAAALDLQLPVTATLAREITRKADTILLPTGVLADGVVPLLRLEGQITERAWHLPATGMTTLQILLPLRDELEKTGWTVVLDCFAAECGGFDFRFRAPVLTAPDMFVDLFDFRYLHARRGAGDAAEHVALMVSSAGQSGYVQITHVRPGPVPAPVERASAPAGGTDEADAVGLGARLLSEGHVILDDLDLASGAGQLGPGPYASLQALAAFLLARPGHRVALVGHTDSVGGSEANIALSRTRAEAVRERLVSTYGVPPAQVEAQGIGALSPVASNRTAEGRERNRRVEAVLLESE